MARDRGPVEKLERREGVNLGLKGRRALAGKSALERRPYPPGEHGRRRQRVSTYAEQLREKQRAKRFYGLRENQFRRIFERARRRKGVVGNELLTLLELRLDNVVTRLGLAATRRQARQMVSHGHVTVNGRRVDIPSFEVTPGDVVSVLPGSAAEPIAREATELVERVPPWLLADHDALAGRVLRLPRRDEIQTPVEPQRIVELYSR
ncbi:MAG TPA: 30S ribosomal protein S4 [Solirubrobacteraceae bacterium]|jgi:small subunit ribosomal protein S4